MGVGCGEQGEEQKCILGFMGKPEERHHLQETVTQGITLRWCFKKQNGTEGLHTSGCGEVQAVASTEHGKDKFNIVHFLCNCSISTVLNPLAYTDGCQTAGLSRSIFTQPAVRRSEPSMSFLLILAFCQ